MIRPRDVLSHVEYAESGCWLWTGARNRTGYGWLQDPDTGIHVPVHRWAYRYYVGPIPHGLSIDHRCHTFDLACSGGNHDPHRRCFNPDDLEAVTHAENQRRRALHVTHCPQGHPYDERNTRLYRGARICRQCARDRQAAKRAEEQAYWTAYWLARPRGERNQRVNSC